MTWPASKFGAFLFLEPRPKSRIPEVINFKNKFRTICVVVCRNFTIGKQSSTRPLRSLHPENYPVFLIVTHFEIEFTI